MADIVKDTENIETKTTDPAEKVEEKGTAAVKETPAPRTFTQQEVDEIVKNRLARVKTTEPTEDGRIKELEDALNAQYKKIMRYETEKMASSLNFKPERLEAVLRLADLSDVKFKKNGEFNTDEIKGKLEKVAADYPEFLIPAKEEKPKSQGFIKAGIEQGEVNTVDDIYAQIKKGFGLKN